MMEKGQILELTIEDISTEGQGIGLYVSKKMAEALSGDIFMKVWEAEDTTEVTLIIPVSIG